MNSIIPIAIIAVLVIAIFVGWMRNHYEYENKNNRSEHYFPDF